MKLWIILGVVVLIALFFIGIYNRLIALRQNRAQSFADIDVQLKQRFDLVPQLVETVKGYATHEKQVLQDVVNARASVQQATTTDGKLQAENMLTRAIGGLFAVAENYPDLKANQSFQQLMSELSDIENKLAAARRYFNNATSEYNTALQQFPASLIAPAMGFTPAAFFEVPSDQRAAIEKAPDVTFN